MLRLTKLVFSEVGGQIVSLAGLALWVYGYLSTGFPSLVNWPAVALMSSAASAATLSLVGSGYSSHTLTSNFDLDNVGAPYTSLTGGFGVEGDTLSVLLSGVKDSTNGLSVDGPAKVTYTYLGKE